MDNILTIFLILSINKAFCQVTVSPSTVLLINQPTKINCTSTTNPPFWTFNGANIAGSFSGPCMILNSSLGLSSVEAPNDRTCNLVISSVALQNAGNYLCADGNAYSTSFLAIVTDHVKCESNSTVTSIDNPVSLTCSATMSSNGNNETQVTWTPTSSTTATTSPLFNNYVNNISSSSITTKLNSTNPAPSIPPYTCVIRLAKYNYADSCNTPAINVHYQVCCMKLSGYNDNSINYGSPLKCTVSSNPPATITMKYSNGTTLVGCTPTTNQLACPITQQDNYTCTAFTNGSLAGDITISASIFLNVTNIPTTTVTTTASSTAVSDAVSSPPSTSDIPLIVGLCVGLGLGIPLLIILIVCCCRRCKRKNPATTTAKANTTQQYNNNGYDGYERHPPEGEIQPYLAENKTQAAGNSDIYAELQMDNKPRSRQPIQIVENTEYATVLKA